MSAKDDALTRAEHDRAERFWYEPVGEAVTSCDAIPPPKVVSEDKKHWIEIALVDTDGNPVPGESYKITTPGGGEVTGTLNEKGKARVEGIDPGTCIVTFPVLDRDSWSTK
ncbi:MAG: carboxypeptidase-like regulatory domain-containing protein [Bryobacteraceae bacterium]